MNYTNGLPKGAVIMWHGDVDDIPDGWAICDGKDGLTPDLRRRFIVGAEETNYKRTSDGLTSEKEDYSYKKEEGTSTVTLGLAQMPIHYHDVYFSSDGKSSDNQGWAAGSLNGVYVTNRASDSNRINSASMTTRGERQPIATSGGDQPHENRPPFYALFFIKRII